MNAISKKIVVVFGLLIVAQILFAQANRSEGTFTNPLVISQDSADPWMFYHEGYYYFTATLDPENGVWLWRSKKLAGIDSGEKKQIYTAPKNGLRSKQIWAPEIHHLNNRWYLYVTASDGIDENHRIYVFESKTDDPWSEYRFKAKVFDKQNDGWAIDATVFRDKKGKLYIFWCGHVPDNGNGIYIAPMKNPWTISGKRVLISQAEFAWEKVRYPINEAPEMLTNKSKTFLIYSASDTGTPDYSLGMLSLEGKDLLNKKSWIKSPESVFSKLSNADGNVFGPGHNGFFKSPDGQEDWIIYHAKEISDYTYKGRRSRAQKFSWKNDDSPDFGRPIPAGKVLSVPSGE